MTKFVRVLAIAGLLTQSSASIAGLVLQPVPVADETARFDRGLPSITIRRGRGTIQVRPRPLDHGSVAFDIAIFNNGESPANFDTANIEANANGATLRPFTLAEMEKKAKSRAMWSQIAVAALAGAAAGAAASQRDTYRSTLVTPHGVYRGYYSRPSVGGQIAAAGMIAGGGIAISRIDDQLRATLDNMQDNVIQVTTIDPGDSYAGMVVLQKISGQKAPQQLRLQVLWNGETYPFAFQLVKEGTPMPVFASLSTAAQDDSPKAIASNPVTAVLPQGPAIPEPKNIAPEAAKPRKTAPASNALAAPVMVDTSLFVGAK